MPTKGPAAAAAAAEPYKPKIIPGKVALCANCGGYSIHIDRCTNCKRIIKEGAKILPDPEYKPPPEEKKPGLPPDLRNVRMAPKGRPKKQSDEPECIALSSDEEDANDANDAQDASDGAEDRTNASAGASDSGDKSDAQNAEGNFEFDYVKQWISRLDFVFVYVHRFLLVAGNFEFVLF